MSDGRRDGFREGDGREREREGEGDGGRGEVREGERDWMREFCNV